MYFCATITPPKNEELEELMGAYTYRYPHPALTADCVVFGFDGQTLKVLLIERGNEPCKGLWAFPGGFMQIDETIEECARRELQEETGLRVEKVRQFGVFSAVERDPRERVVSVGCYTLVKLAEVKGGDDAAQARWWAFDEVPPLAFDHDIMLRQALCQIRRDLCFEPIGLELLGEPFAMAELQRLYEGVLGENLDRQDFCRKMVQTGVVKAVGATENCRVSGQVEGLFCFDKVAYECAKEHYRMEF